MTRIFFSLMLACFGGHEEVARCLKNAGAKWSDVDRGGSTALHWAVDGRNCELIQWMIENGAKVEVVIHLLYNPPTEAQKNLVFDQFFLHDNVFVLKILIIFVQYQGLACY